MTRSGRTIQVGAGVTLLEALEAAGVDTLSDCRRGECGLCVTDVVACDGARSFVRRKIGDTREDLGFDEPWLVVDVLLRRPMPELGDFSVQFCDPDRAATYVRGTGVRRRWEIALKPGEDPARMTEPANVWGLLSRWITPGDAVLERAAADCLRWVSAG